MHHVDVLFEIDHVHDQTYEVAMYNYVAGCSYRVGFEAPDEATAIATAGGHLRRELLAEAKRLEAIAEQVPSMIEQQLGAKMAPGKG